MKTLEYALYSERTTIAETSRGLSAPTSNYRLSSWH